MSVISPYSGQEFEKVVKIGKATFYVRHGKEKIDIQRAIDINREILADAESRK